MVEKQKIIYIVESKNDHSSTFKVNLRSFIIKYEKTRYLKAFFHIRYYSNSIVPGGFEVISYITLFTPRTSLIILDITLFNTS